MIIAVMGCGKMKDIKCTRCIYEWIYNWSKIKDGECDAFKESKPAEKEEKDAQRNNNDKAV